jgi:molybdopterin-binding protein
MVLDRPGLIVGHTGQSRPQGDRRRCPGQILAHQRTPLPRNPLGVPSSARNRFVGLVTNVISDKVMTHVEMQCGPYTVVSLMSTEAARELKLEPGSVAAGRRQGHHRNRRNP